MRKQIYISADYAEDDGDRPVVDALHRWGEDKLHKVNFIDMAEVKSGSVSNDEDCRACDLKAEFNRQINKSSAVIFIVGDKTAKRTAGSQCLRVQQGREVSDWQLCNCTPYKQNTNGVKKCKVRFAQPAVQEVGNINSYSYLQHEFEQAKKMDKQIIIFYNSRRYEKDWLPSYMKESESLATPFWCKNKDGVIHGNYQSLKGLLEDK